MENCKTCKYWTAHKGKVTGECDKPDHFDGKSTNDKEFSYDIFVHDDSGLTVTLVTGENFGCILHQPKP